MANYATQITDVGKQILLALKKRYDLNPKQENLIFELGGFGIKLDNENDYLNIVAALDGLEDNTGIEYVIEKTYNDRRGRIKHHTLYELRLCKIKIVDKKKFKRALEKSVANPLDNESEADKSNVIQYKNLRYDLRTFELSHKNGKTILVSPERREAKFFLHLYQNKGNVCPFKDLAREIGTPEYIKDPELANQDYTEEVSVVKRDFRKLLLSIGMTAKEFDQLIDRVPKLGYRLP